MVFGWEFIFYASTDVALKLILFYNFILASREEIPVDQ